MPETKSHPGDEPGDLGKATRAAFRAFYGDDPILFSDLTPEQRKAFERVALAMVENGRSIRGMRMFQLENLKDHIAQYLVTLVSKFGDGVDKAKAFASANDPISTEIDELMRAL